MRVISIFWWPSRAAMASSRMPRLMAWVASVWRSRWGCTPGTPAAAAARRTIRPMMCRSRMPRWSATSRLQRRMCSRFAADRFHVPGPGHRQERLGLCLLIVFPAPGGGEETGRGQLVGITRDHGPVGTHEGPDCVGGCDLGCFVEDDNVEAPLGRQQLRY